MTYFILNKLLKSHHQFINEIHSSNFITTIIGMVLCCAITKADRNPVILYDTTSLLLNAKIIGWNQHFKFIMVHFLALLLNLVLLVQFAIPNPTPTKLLGKSEPEFIKVNPHNDTLVFGHVVSKGNWICLWVCRAVECSFRRFPNWISKVKVRTTQKKLLFY